MPDIFNKLIVGKKESVVDQILLLDEHQTPLLNLMGFSEVVTQIERKWWEDAMFGADSTASEGALVGATSIVVVDSEPFRANQVIKIDEEMLLVTAVNHETKTLTVARGYANTTASAVALGDKVEVLFVEGVEGSDARDGRYKPRVSGSNITQIFDETISISGTAAAIDQYAIGNLYEYEKVKAQRMLALQLEKALINGIKYESSDGKIRQMDGVRNFIKSNVTDATAGAITDSIIGDAMQKIYEVGGFKAGGNYKIMVPAKQKRAISAFEVSKIELSRIENTRGQVVDHIVNDFGNLEIIMNSNLKSDEIIITDTNRMKVRPLTGREFSHEYLGKKGDYYAGQIVGEYTLEFLQEKAHSRIKNLK